MTVEQYKCALRHSRTWCRVYGKIRPGGRCKSSCSQFIASRHICKNQRIMNGEFTIRVVSGLGDCVEGIMEHVDDKGYGDVIQFCPYCGERLAYNVSALRLRREQITIHDEGSAE